MLQIGLGFSVQCCGTVNEGGTPETYQQYVTFVFGGLSFIHIAQKLVNVN